MGSPAFGGGSVRPPPSVVLYPPLTRPVVQAVFNHPDEYSAQGTDWQDIDDEEEYLAVYAGELSDGVTHPHILIQVSMYRVADTLLANALQYAAYYGATVQVLLDGGAETEGCHGVVLCVNPTFHWLEELNQINKLPGRSNTWLRTCSGFGPGRPLRPPVSAGKGCLGQALNHNKFMLVSQGALWKGHSTVSDVVLQTSSNDDQNQYADAFNNALVIANRPAVYHDYQRYFAREAAAYDSTEPSSAQLFTRRTGTTIDNRSLSGHHIETVSYPRAATDDPLVTALKSVSTARRCANRAASSGSPARTTIDLGMFAISGRGAALHELSRLAAAGCPVHIVYSNISRAAYRTLHQRNISLQQLCTTATDPVQGEEVKQARYFVHSKYLLIAGTIRGLGRNRRIVYTGSTNLGTGSLTNADNRDIRYVEPATKAPIFSAYQRNFRQMRRLGAEKPELGHACSAKDN